jgi:hypothetical protein
MDFHNQDSRDVTMALWSLEMAKVDADPAMAWDGVLDFLDRKQYEGPPRDPFILRKHVAKFCREKRESLLQLPRPMESEEEHRLACDVLKKLKEGKF